MISCAQISGCFVTEHERVTIYRCMHVAIESESRSIQKFFSENIDYINIYIYYTTYIYCTFFRRIFPLGKLV